MSTFPTKSIRIGVDKENVLKNGIVSPKNADEIVDNIFIKLDGNVVYKNRLLMLDIIANNDWKRPIYFTGGSFGDDDYLWMKDYLQLDGVAYKLVPIQTPLDPRNPYNMGRIDSDKMYNLVKKWDWGNMGDPNIYQDPETRKNSITYRSNLARLVETLLQEGDKERAKDVLDLAMENMPVDYYGYYTLLEPYIRGYFEVGEPEKAKQLFEKVASKYQEDLKYYSGWDQERQYNYADDIITSMERYRSLVDVLILSGEREYAREKAEEFNNYLKLFPQFYDNSPQQEQAPPTPTKQDLMDEFNRVQKLDSLDTVE